MTRKVRLRAKIVEKTVKYVSFVSELSDSDEGRDLYWPDKFDTTYDRSEEKEVLSVESSKTLELVETEPLGEGFEVLGLYRSPEGDILLLLCKEPKRDGQHLVTVQKGKLATVVTFWSQDRPTCNAAFASYKELIRKGFM